MQSNALTGFRLSPQQTRLWLSGDAPACHAQCALTIEGPLDVPALQGALGALVGRHEILRTTFHRRPGMKVPLQVIQDEAAPEWRDLDLRTVAPAGRDARVAEVMREERRRPFDLERGPVVRAALLAVAADRHVLVLTLPALNADARSLRNLVGELAAAYAGEEPTEAPLQYADYCEWQSQLLEATDADAEEAKRFWAEAAAEAPPALTLVFQGKAAPDAAFEPEAVAATITPEVGRRIEALAQAQGASPDVVLLACWQALLGRLAAQSEVGVGVVLDNRRQDELQGALGLFAQTVPVRGHAETRPFADDLRQAHDAVARASNYQEYFGSREQAVAAVQFEAETWPAGLPARGVRLSVSHLSCHLGRFALKLSCAPAGEGWAAEFSYDPAVFRAEDVRRVAGYFVRLLERLTGDAATPAAAADLLDEAERRQLLEDFNQTAADYPAAKCLHQLFEEQAARTPDRPALAFEGRRLAYAELNARANRLAHHLRKAGVGRNVPVGLYVERSADMIVGLLGVLKAGGAYVPLHADLPKARLDHLLAETKAPVVLTQEKLRNRLPAGREAVCLDGDSPAWAGESAHNPEPVNTPDDLVYVIYTSGSTGTPKGVANRHRNLVNYTHFITKRLGLDRPENAGGLHFATVSTLSADLGNTCIFPALVSGGCLHVLGYETSMSGRQWMAYAAQNPIDVLKITPSHLSAILSPSEAAAILPRKFLLLGGEALSWKLIGQVKAAGKCAVLNHYGPTETTVGSLTFDVAAGEPVRALAATVPVGRPIANTRVYVLDPQGQPVPLGVRGELYIGGAGVAQGYLNQPEQTAERFVQDPFAGDPAARMYRTGDRVRLLPDGNIEFLGRMDQQIKIRGFRVEPAEVEAVLRRHPAVQQAIVLPHEDKAGEKHLVAYVVPAAGQKADVEGLRAYLRDRMPDYMVPASLVPLASLPLTPNGKVDRMALPDPSQARSAAEFVAPRNATEEQLAGIWAEVLKVERVGAQDNFFDLGGHSLLATQVISRVRNAFGVQLPLRSIFEAPTLAGLAGAIVQVQEEQADDEDMQGLLAEVAGMSDEEVERLLAAELEQGNS